MTLIPKVVGIDGQAWKRAEDNEIEPEPLPTAAFGSNSGGMDGTWRTKVDEQLGKLEVGLGEVKAAIDGLKHSQTLMNAAVALLLAVMLYTLNRVDNLPNEFRGIADAITGAVTATRAVDQRQTAPQIIQVPPQPPVIIQVPAAPAAPRP